MIRSKKIKQGYEVLCMRTYNEEAYVREYSRLYAKCWWKRAWNPDVREFRMC